jgi:CRISPR-associated protein Csd2
MTTTTNNHLSVGSRHDFVLLFDVADGNPNGDPDAGNLPRVDPITMQGLVTDVAIKRKVRDWVDQARGIDERYKIYVQHRGILANQQRRAFEALDKGPADRPDDEAREWMCKNFYDIRMFGAVMTVGQSGQKRGSRNLHWNCGQVRGPLQIMFARSIDAIDQLDIPITRVALTNADDARSDVSSDDDIATSGQMGRKSLVPYGLYRGHGFFNPHFAKQTGVTEEDLSLFWQALQNMWDLDHSASRGMMACRGLYVFSHASSLGNAPAHTLFDRITVERRPEVEAPRAFKHYEVTIDEAGLPADVTLTRLVG